MKKNQVNFVLLCAFLVLSVSAEGKWIAHLDRFAVVREDARQSFLLTEKI